MRVVAIIQARMGSARLPGKVLKSFGGAAVLWHVAQRVGLGVPDAVLAIPDTAENHIIHDYATNELGGLDIYRGPETDVLARYWGAALHSGADYVVRVTADCPLVQPEHIRAVIAMSVGRHAPVRTHPFMARGLDVECFPLRDLAMAYEFDTKPEQREHVTSGIAMKEFYRGPTTDSRHRMRWTLDTEEDYAWFCRLAQHVNTEPPHPTTEEVLDYIAKTGDVLYEPEA